MPQLSVALCSFNGELYIREQIESILNQTVRVDEIIVCDDGSTDNTLPIIDSYRNISSTDIRIYRNEKNLGVCANFQKAVDLCHGDIIFLSDQDDIWSPNKVETIVHYFNSNEQTQVVFTDGQLINDSGEAISDGTLWKCFGVTDKCRNLIDRGFGIEIFAYENRATGATMALRNIFHYTHSFSNYCIADILHDGALAMLALANNQLGYIDKCLICYRIHKNQECGIGGSLQEPLTDAHKEISHTATLWSQQNLHSPLKERISFITYRHRHQSQPLGLFRMLYSIGTYCKYYRNEWFNFLLFDIRQWVIAMWRYVKNAIN